MPLQATSGAASYDAFGGGVAAVPNYIEECFSAFLYTGNGSTQTITNGIDLAGKGGLYWWKVRNIADSNYLVDTTRGATKWLVSNSTGAEQTVTTSGLAFNNSGVSFNNAFQEMNQSGNTFASWTFRKQPKFFDVVTYTGNDTAGRTIAHNLGSVPGCIIVKPTNSPMNWFVYHRSLGNTKSINLNLTSAATTVDNWGNTTPTSTVFTVDSGSETNQSGVTYVAYLFAHDAGGFGLTGTDNVISCGSYTGTGAVGNKITLGYEPQWLLIKRTDTANSWYLFDTMRGLSLTQSLALLPNGTNSDLDYGSSFQLNADGVTQNNANSAFNASGGTYIYIAIRRGPMKVPTSGTSVFSPVTTTGTGTNSRVITGVGFSPDMIINCTRGATTLDRYTQDRLRGVKPTIYTNSTSAEQADQGIYAVGTLDMTGFTQGTSAGVGFNSASDTYVFYNFRRAPSFFDEVCYTGDGNNPRTINHNLGVAPELMIVKSRSNAFNWSVYNASIGATNYLYLNLTTASSAFSGFWNDTSPTASVFSVGGIDAVNGSGFTYVAYLFATCAGVSKCTAFTGTGTLQTINCGFTVGSRFVLIKRTDAAGDWYVWDSSRGLSSSTDPYLLLNSTAAEVTSTNWVDTTATGFQVTAASGNNVNINGASYIALAIA